MPIGGGAPGGGKGAKALGQQGGGAASSGGSAFSSSGSLASNDQSGGSAFGGSGSLASDGGPIAPGTPANAVWKDPILQTFDAARQAASTPGVGITNQPMLDAARLAKQQAIMAYKQSMMPQGFSGDPNSLVPRGTTSGGVNQYYDPATGGMFVGNPFQNTGGQNTLASQLGSMAVPPQPQQPAARPAGPQVAAQLFGGPPW